MDRRTRQKLDELAGYPWFETVGEPVAGDVLPVNSWEDAMRLSNGAVWESVQLQVSNRLARQINRRDWPRFSQWNQLVEQVKAAMEPIVQAKVVAVATQHSLPEAFLHCVRWDIMCICLEAEYADLYAPTFFIPQLARWYGVGHFPCGWDGPELDTDLTDLPPHRLFVY
jgi:hypothetical protein